MARSCYCAAIPLVVSVVQIAAMTDAPRLPDRCECHWPMWDHRERATLAFCCGTVALPGAKGVRGTYCATHAMRAVFREAPPAPPRPSRPADVREVVRLVLPAAEAANGRERPRGSPAPKKARAAAPQAPAARAERTGRPRDRLNVDQALALRAAGQTVHQIAAALGVSASTVHRALAARGMQTGRWAARTAQTEAEPAHA